MANPPYARNTASRFVKRGRGFVQAGGLINRQMQTATAKRGFALARLNTLWRDIAGPDLAPLCQPERLTPVRGPAGGLLKLAVQSAHAPMVQMMIPTMRDKINAALGPGTVGRIQLVHGTPQAETTIAETRPLPQQDHNPSIPDDMAQKLDHIKDDRLRAALETLTRNVMSNLSEQKT